MFTNIKETIKETIKNNDVKTNLDDYPYIKNFKKQKLESRIQISDKILLKYTDRIPIIVDCKKDINIDRNKYIVPKNLTIAQFLFILKKRINIESSQSIFLLCNNQLLMSNDLISHIYTKLKDNDGFLYIYISLENTFGNYLKFY